MELKESIKTQYRALVEELGVPVTRTVFRKYGTHICTSGLIDKLWGNWGNFTKEFDNSVSITRAKTNIVKKTSSDRVLITSVTNGTQINQDCWEVLLNYAKQTKSELFVLWGEGVTPKSYFTKDVYALLEPYLCTEVQFTKSDRCIAKDLHIKPQIKDPLSSLDRVFSDEVSHVIVASPKQYLKMLPYECNRLPRQAWSTGTISEIEYKSDVSGQINDCNVTFGGVLATYNKKLGYYQIRNLIYKDKAIFDINQVYKKSGTPRLLTKVPAVVLGDMHFPEEDKDAVNASVDLINTCLPKKVFLHDWCSFNSINHHEEGKCLEKILKTTDDNFTLKTELEVSAKKLETLMKECPNSDFYIVASNHDNFITKWLNEGMFIKDRLNAKIGASLFIKLLDNEPILPSLIKDTKRLHLMDSKESLIICGYEVAAHGHEGIAGARGSVRSYTRAFNKSVSGHTHSPQIFESAVVVGTNSKLNLPYTGKIMNWGQSNVIIHENGTIQQIFCN